MSETPNNTEPPDTGAGDACWRVMEGSLAERYGIKPRQLSDKWALAIDDKLLLGYLNGSSPKDGMEFVSRMLEFHSCRRRLDELLWDTGKQ